MLQSGVAGAGNVGTSPSPFPKVQSSQSYPPDMATGERVNTGDTLGCCGGLLEKRTRR